MDNTHGTCSKCGGRVTTPQRWYGMMPPIPTCENCGATLQQPHGEVLPMEGGRKGENFQIAPSGNKMPNAIDQGREPQAKRPTGAEG